LHAKPIGLLAVDDYWASLLGWLDHAVGEGFVPPEHRRLMLEGSDLASLLAAFEDWSPPAGRWLR
jgi:predicted Rossmann-fold nucleotide-binding protein